MSESDDFNRKFPLCLLKLPNFGFLPLIDYRNKLDEKKIYHEELSWRNAGACQTSLDSIAQIVRDSRLAIDRCYETAMQSIERNINAVEANNAPMVPFMPKTPKAAKKSRFKKGAIAKKKSIVVEPVRRSTRRTKQSLIGSDQFVSLLMQQCPKSFAEKKSKKNVVEHKRDDKNEDEDSQDNLISHNYDNKISSTDEERATCADAEMLEDKSASDNEMSVDQPPDIEQSSSIIIDSEDDSKEVEQASADASSGPYEEVMKRSRSHEDEIIIQKAVCGMEGESNVSKVKEMLNLRAIVIVSPIHNTIDANEKSSSITCEKSENNSTSQTNNGLNMEDDIIHEETRSSHVHRKSRRSTLSTKVLGGLAAKRNSTRQSLRLKTMLKDQAAKQAQLEKPATTDEDDETVSEDDEQTETEDKQTKKIIKPVIKPKPKRQAKKPTVTSLKRTRANKCLDGSFDFGNKLSDQGTSCPPKQRRLPMLSVSSFIQNNTWRTPSTPRTYSRFKSPHLMTPTSSKISNIAKSFLLRNTPEKPSKEEDVEAKRKILLEKQQKDEERKRKKEAEKQEKLAETKKKREERAKRAIQMRELREKAERERQDRIHDRWEQRIADADRTRNLRKIEDCAKMMKNKEKMAKIEAKRKEEEDEKMKRLKEQEEDRERRLKQHHAEKKSAEEQRIKEKKLEEKQRKIDEERQKMERLEEERKRIEEEKQKEMEEIEEKRRKQEQEAAEKKQKQREKLKKMKEERERLRMEWQLQKKQKKLEERRQLLEEENRAREEQRRLEEINKQEMEQEMLRKQEAKKKKEELRKRVEEERRVKEMKLKLQNEAKQKNDHQNDDVFTHEHESSSKTWKNNLNTTHSVLATPSSSKTNPNESIDNYNMTPRGPGRPMKPSTAENYNIDDFVSGDSTDNEDEPKKVVPKWAKGALLQSAVINQYRYPPDLDVVFPNLLSPVSLSSLFKKHKERYFKRTSSAQWNSPIMPPGHISFTKQCRGFD